MLVGHKHLREGALDVGVVADECDVRNSLACFVTGHVLTCTGPFLSKDAAAPTTLEQAHGRLIQIETQGFLVVGDLMVAIVEPLL